MLQNFGTDLSREQMKLVLGGVYELDEAFDGGSSGCCWSTGFGGRQACGLTRAQAESKADTYAIDNPWGDHGYWCCASC
jgi:hypothetical protein